MLYAFVVPESLSGPLVGALVGGLFGSGIVAFLTQRWIEKREHRSRRQELRLELYLEVVDLILDNELSIAEATSSGQIPSVELQKKRLRISHRLKLLGSKPVREAFAAYQKLVFAETAQPTQYRPLNPDEVVNAREQLVRVMSDDVNRA